MERHALSSALEDAVGERTVRALLFCTHDLEPEFFEQEVLPVFLGNDLKHNRRTREVQLDYVIRERQLPIDVFYEPRALVSSEGAARLGWHRHAMRVGRGLFHPKLVLALVADRDGTESLVLCVGSANLTRSSWWRNIECAEVLRLSDGQRHGYVPGLVGLLDRLARSSRRSSGEAPQPALREIRRFLRRQQGYTNSSVNGRLVPHLVGPGEALLERLQELGGTRLLGAHLEIIAPFFDGSPAQVVRRLTAWREALDPLSVRLALPARDGRTPLQRDIFDAIEQLPWASWATLPPAFAKASDIDGASDRALHAKLYRLWRGGRQPFELVVLGSHNFTQPAHSGLNNWEVSVVLEPEQPHGARLLNADADRPGKFAVYEDDLGLEGVEDPIDIPLWLAFDWNNKTASARWSGRSLQTVTLLRAGETLFSVEVSPGQSVMLDEHSARELEDALLTSSLFNCRREDGGEGVILCEELNHDTKPDLLESLELTPAEIFALWSVDGLEDRLRRIAAARGTLAPDEDDLELDAELPPLIPSMFEKFAGVLHAFASLRARVDAAMAEGNVRRAGRTIFSQQFDSPYNALRVLQKDTTADPALCYVAWTAASVLDRDIALLYPGLVEEFAVPRAGLTTMLAHRAVVRRGLVESSDDPDMDRFLDWFDREFEAESGDD